MRLAELVRVCLPTVAARRAVLQATLAQWRAFGLDPVVVEQDPSLPLHHSSQYRTAQRALAAALDGWDGPVLMTEDDVDLAPELGAWLPTLVSHELVTLYVPGRRCYPAWVYDALDAGEPLPYRIERLREPSLWYGSLGVVMSNEIARAVLAHPPLQFGWDAHLREWCLLSQRPMQVMIPNLVQQRRVPPASTRHGGRHRSVTYGRGAVA